MLKLLEALENRLSNILEPLEVRGKNCFLTESGAVIHLTAVPKYNAIVVEFADNRESAEKLQFEDGDAISTDGLGENDENEILSAILREIERS